MTETELVHYRVDDHVASLVLDSQHNRNALSQQLVRELYDGLATGRGRRRRQGRADPGRGPHVLLRRGPRRRRATEGMEQAAGVLVELQRRIATLPKPVVTRVHGNVRAGGIGIVAASDVAISAHDATYAFTEVRLGLTPAAISLSVLPRMTDRSAALTFLTGEVFTGRDAERMGLVTKAVAEDELNLEVDEVCASLAKGNPQGLRETKLLLGRAAGRADRRARRRPGEAVRPAVRVRGGQGRDAGLPQPEEVARLEGVVLGRPGQGRHRAVGRRQLSRRVVAVPGCLAA